MRFWLRILATVCAFGLLAPARAQEPAKQAPLRLAIAGLVHGHVSGFLRGAQARRDVEIVGVFDPDAALLRQYGERYKLPDSVLFTDLSAMLDRTKPEAVASFTNTYDHPAIVASTDEGVTRVGAAAATGPAPRPRLPRRTAALCLRLPLALLGAPGVVTTS